MFGAQENEGYKVEFISSTSHDSCCHQPVFRASQWDREGHAGKGASNSFDFCMSGMEIFVENKTMRK